MIKIIKENKNNEEEQIIKANEEKALEGEFYYMSTRYKSLIPLINEVKAQRGEIEHLKSKLADAFDKIEKLTRYIEGIINR